MKIDIEKEIEIINKMDIEQKARNDTFTEFINEADDQKIKQKLEKKLEDAILKYEIERRFHEKKKDELQRLILEEQNSGNKPRQITIFDFHNNPKRDHYKIQVFFDVLQNLQGIDKKPVLFETLKEHLLNLLIFGEKDVKKYMERLLRDGIIYESVSNHYNTV